MQTVTIKVNSETFAKTLTNTFKNHKEVKEIYFSEESVDENFAAPGPPMSLDQFKARIKKAEKSKLLSRDEAINYMNKWKAKKEK